MLVAEGLEKEGVLWIAGLDGITGVAACLQAGAGVEQQAAFSLGGGAVAFVALLREDGTDAGLEEVELLRSRRGEEMAERNKKGRKKLSFMPGAYG